MSKLLIPAQRRDQIQEYLAIHRIAKNSDLCRLLNASEATVRRDLEWLENAGFIERTHGGAILRQKLDSETEYRHRAQLHSEEKRWIGKVAASMIDDGDIVFINSGTTATQIIRYIPNNSKITVITNNLIAALEVGEVNYELILLGGAYQPKSNSVAGRFAITNLSQVYANKTFIGVDSIDMKYGCTVPSIAEAEIIRLMLERTHGDIAICADHSKWGMTSNFEVARIDQVHTWITDNRLDQKARATMSRISIDVIFADENP